MTHFKQTLFRVILFLCMRATTEVIRDEQDLVQRIPHILEINEGLPNFGLNLILDHPCN